MANFPTSLDSLANPTATTRRNDPGFELDVVIATLNDIAEQLEAKLGIGASAPGAGAAVLRRTAAGASAWGQVVGADINAGGAANRALVTNDGVNAIWSTINGGAMIGPGTMVDGNFSGNTIHGNKIIDGTIDTSKITDGTITNADIAAHAISTGVVSSSWSQAISSPSYTWLNASAQVALNGLPAGSMVLVLLYGWVANNVAAAASYVGIGDNTNTGTSSQQYVTQNPTANLATPFTAVYFNPNASGNHTFYGVGQTSGGSTATFNGSMAGFAIMR